MENSLEPRAEAIRKEGVGIMERADAIQVSDNVTYEQACDFLNDVKTVVKRIELEFDGTSESPGPVRKAHAAWKAMVALRDKLMEAPAYAERTVKLRIGQYQWQLNEQRRLEAEKAENEARKRAEDERLAQAEKAAQMGDSEGAEALLNAPVPVVVDPVLTPEAPKVKGVSFREDWDFQIVNEAQLPRIYLKPNEEAIRKVVRALGKNTNIPGIVVMPKPVVSSRGKGGSYGK